jgi:hypothetical protein
MFWWVLLALMLFLAITLLFAPIRLYVNTRSNTYFASWGDVVKAAAIPAEDDLEFRLSAFGIGKRFSLLQLLAKPRKHKKEKSKKKKPRKTFKTFPRHLIGPIIRSFKIKQLYANLDLNSVYWNAWLYPWGHIFQHEHIQWSTNFEGKQEFILEIVNRPFWFIQQILRKQLKM